KKNDCPVKNQNQWIDSGGNAVYVVPLRALATEITNKLREKFSCQNCAMRRKEIDHFTLFGNTNKKMEKKLDTLGEYFEIPSSVLENIQEKYKCLLKSKYNMPCLDVMEYTGDTPFQPINARIIVTTPEKLDGCSRKLSFDYNFNLMIIDEIHLLEEERGAVIETLVARFIDKNVKNSTSNVKTPEDDLNNFKPIRIVGLSATVTNTADVAEFLKGPVFHFDDTYRQVPLKMHLIGAKETIDCSLAELEDRRRQYSSNDLQKIPDYKYSDSSKGKSRQKGFGAKIDRNKPIKINNFEEILVEKLLSVTGQTLIFVNSRYDCYKTASLIIRRIILKNEKQQGKTQTKTYDLDAYIRHGIGIHNAGMPKAERQRVESLFLKFELKYVICTKTLAWGLNMPAKNVILYKTKYYSDGQFRDVSLSDVLQIVGRAGRIDYINKEKHTTSDGKDETKHLENFGTAFIISDNLNFYTTKLKIKPPIESCLLRNMINCLNSQIGLETYMSLDSCIKWFKRTFLYVRGSKAPGNYGFNLERESLAFQNEESVPIEIQNYDVTIQNLMNMAITKLKNCNLITKSDLFQSTAEGRIASYYYIDFRTIGAILDFLDERFSIKKLTNDFKNLNVHENKKSQIEKTTVKNDPEIDSVRIQGKTLTNHQTLFDMQFRNLVFTEFSEIDLEILFLLFNMKEFSQISVRAEESESIIRDVQFFTSKKSFSSDKNHLNVSEITVSPIQKLIFLVFQYFRSIKPSIFSLVSDTNFIKKNLSRLLAATEQTALLKERFFVFKTAFLLRKRIDRGTNHKIQYQEIQNEIKIKKQMINEHFCTIFEVNMVKDETFAFFIASSVDERQNELKDDQEKIFHASMFHKKTTLYFAEDLKDFEITIFSENSPMVYKFKEDKIRNEIQKIHLTNLDGLIPYDLSFKKERIALIENDVQILIDSTLEKQKNWSTVSNILVIHDDKIKIKNDNSRIFHFNVSEIMYMIDEIISKSLDIRDIFIAGCFSLELYEKMHRFESAAITILERNDICKFLDSVID
ncbi:RNA helicase, partial [Pseudoloma neurophilia]